METQSTIQSNAERYNIFHATALLRKLAEKPAAAITAKRRDGGGRDAGTYTPTFTDVRQFLPAALPKGHVLVKVTRTSICQTDRRVIAGQKKNALDQQSFCLGHEGGGVVLAAHAGSAFMAGQKVVFRPHLTCMRCEHCQAGDTNLCAAMQHMGIQIQGTFAPYVCLPEACCYGLAPSFHDDLIPLIEPLACVARAWGKLQAALPKLGEERQRMVVYGAGPMGVLAALWGKKNFPRLSVELVDPCPTRRQVVEAQTGFLRVAAASTGQHALSFVACSRFQAYADSVRHSQAGAAVMAFSGINQKDLTLSDRAGAVHPSAGLYETIHREERVVTINSPHSDMPLTMLGSSGYNLVSLRQAIAHLRKHGRYYAQVQNARLHSLTSEMLWQDGQPHHVPGGAMLELLQADAAMELSASQARILKLLIRV